MDIDDLDDDKQQKPKKFAEIKLTIWDDAEMDLECVKYVKLGTGRGAPKKVIMLDKNEFMDDLDAEIMTAQGILKHMIKEMKLENKLKVSLIDNKQNVI